jgi:beta-aspartyl-dipeptidase (metallo-type)
VLFRNAGVTANKIDASGMVLVPGFIDVHAHLIGAGGQAGYATRTPEAQLSEIVNAGVTTVVGLLGTDSVARDPRTLYAKVKVGYLSLLLWIPFQMYLGS